MKKIIDPFIDFLPSIDLHGMDRVCARIKTEEFINDSIKLKNKRVVIIHGIGSGILRKEIADYIHENRDVSPHLRRGHFRMLSSDYFKNKQGQIVFVKSSFVKGNAKTVIE